METPRGRSLHRWLVEPPGRRDVWLALAVFGVVGACLVRWSAGSAVTRWMRIFEPADYPTLADIVEYVLALRVPIPPVLSVLEILSHNLWGDTAWATLGVYRVALLGSFLLAIGLASTRGWRMAASFTLSLVFLWAATVVHPGNAMVYDVVYPCVLLSFVACLRFAASSASPRASYALSAAAGFFLAMAELTRPFVLLFVPILLACAWCALRRLPRAAFGCLLVPLLLISGPWHVHQATRHGQLLWSNHAGFNLARAWPMVEEPPLLSDPAGVPLEEGRWRNLNTLTHGANSERLRDAVLSYVVAHPVESAVHVAERGASLLFSVKTSIYEHRPEHPVFAFYRPAVRLAAVWLVLNGVLLAWVLARGRRGRLDTLGSPDAILLLIASLSAGIVAFGESDAEHARFLVSLLPFLAALPTVVADQPPAPGESRGSTTSGG